MPPEIVWAPSPFFSTGWWRRPTNDAMHSTAASLASTLATFTNPNSSRKVSAHYTIDGFEGVIYQHVALENRAWHALGANEFAYGIEHVDNGPWGEHGPHTYELSGWLLGHISREHQRIWGVPLPINDDVVGPHSRWVATACPARLDLARVILEAGGHTDMPTEAEWQEFLAENRAYREDVRISFESVKKHLNPLIGHEHGPARPPSAVRRGVVKNGLLHLPVLERKPYRAPRRPTAAQLRAGHGRGPSRDKK